MTARGKIKMSPRHQKPLKSAPGLAEVRVSRNRNSYSKAPPAIATP